MVGKLIFRKDAIEILFGITKTHITPAIEQNVSLTFIDYDKFSILNISLKIESYCINGVMVSMLIKCVVHVCL